MNAAVMLMLVNLISHPDPTLPDPIKTPGIFLADATVAKICQKGYTATIRHVTEEQKKEVFKEYGLEQSGNYEVDHLISLELGGSNDTTNLWPQSYHGIWGARIKDGLENRMHELVCMGKLDLRQAQYDISHDWIKAYCKYMNNDNCRGVNPQ